MGPLITRTDVIRRLSVLVLFAGALALCGCQDDTSAKKGPSQPKTDQLETGRFALQKMLPAARLWSGDALPVHLASSISGDSEGRDGKSIFWRGNFASRSRQKAESFTWSGAADASPRVDHGVEDPFNPN